MPPNYRERSSSNGSTFSAASGLEISTKRKNDYSGTSPLYPSETGSYGNIHMSPPSRAPYAPSPSLVGANDPLGRTASRAPLITFGFGGKVVTCFHNSADLITGFDVALSSLRTLHNVLPQGILDSSTVSYPGPLFSDPGTPVTGLVKTKKARVLKYLEERTDEISRGVSYVSNILEKRHMEDKLALVKLLMVLVDNDGTLSGSQHIDGAVRAALVPNAASAESAQDGLFAPSFTSPIPNAHGLAPAIPTINEAPIAVTTLLPSALDKIEDFLVRGERKQAYHYALDEKLWAHAMVIASSIDKDAWKEVVQEFIKTELGSYDISKHGAAPGSHEQSPSTNGREWLRVAYSLFSGQGPTAIQQLIPTKLLAGSTGTLQLPTAPMAHITPMSPNFPAPNVTAQIPVDSLCKWREIVSTLISTPLAPDWSATLTALGDYLISHNFVEAAHACYLLSPQTSVIGGVGSPSARVVLVGARSPHSSPSFAKDFDSIIFSEIAEFAFSLKQPAKGQDPFHGFPHLQAYKMIRASYLMEMGYVQVATRYCEAISGSMGRPSPYFNTVLSDQLKGLADRLIGAPHVGKGVAWIGGKMSKPSLDSIGNWLEGRLTKFIAGEGDEPPAPPHQSSSNQQSAFAGPFSTISSTTTSASPSPPPSMINIHAMSGNVPPRRTGSAMAIPSAQAHAPIDRASSAMEYYRPGRSSSPGPRQPYNPPSVPMASPYGHMGNGHASNEGPNQDESESGGWWNSLNSADSAPTPTAANFHQVDNYSPSQDGFISLMDDPALSVTPSPPISQSRQYEGDDMDDLGLGNSNKHSRAQETEVGSGETTSSPTTASAHPNDTTEVKPPAASAAAAAAASGSWLSRFWKRGDTAPGPVKASLGEETSFYYDKDQKRWVNKKAGAEDVKPATPPPPPSRAQTASPGRTTGLPAVPNSTPPPQRSASAIDLSNSPPNKPPMRIRSNLVPPEFASVPNTPATAPLPGMSGTPPPSASLGGPPPPGRPRSQATKRNVRSRYVDVFQQEASA
ncbi:Sec23-binding domain of Sec16-domain-containing protein [Hygrophoropsis aurantiaca]|uniref:Sec23-binding domain of Sec16-domain-containing protein n=1 Tax=Hygrophoropsis aurantiaca TaxID=72124 RepID=A0ACB8AN60_9AGAM|nr:Sec23-binding domain of Sec16-domain-containing protein [Hygrophoropsis aurantiaca]